MLLPERNPVLPLTAAVAAASVAIATTETDAVLAATTRLEPLTTF